MMRRRWILMMMAGAALAMVLGSVGMADRTPSASADSHDRLHWQGQEWYVHGANLPWYNWGCDFGCRTGGGVVENASTIGQRIDGDFNVVRWWVFPGNPWQLQDIESTFADFDRALELAEEHDIYYTFTLFSSPTEVNLADPHGVAQKLRPLFERYGDHPHILSWEVFNEPEFAIWNGEVTESATVDFTRVMVDAIHAHTHSLAGIGHAILDGIPMWDSVDLDYFQPHWYDYMSSGNWCALCTTAAEVQDRYGDDKPIVIGEFYAGEGIDARSRLEEFYDRGYAGAWAWSLFPERTNDGMTIDLDAYSSFASAHGDLGPAAGGDSTAPTATATPQSLPNSYRINAGGNAIEGWAADDGSFVDGGNTFSASTGIDTGGLAPEAVFQSERWGEQDWALPIADGTYTVDLYFAEIYSGTFSDGARVFDVMIEDRLVLDDFDIYAEVGENTGLVRSFSAEVSDGQLNIDFDAVVQNPKVSGIGVTPAEDVTPHPTATPTPVPTSTPEPTSTPQLTNTPTPTPAAVEEEIHATDVEWTVSGAVNKNRVSPGAQVFVSADVVAGQSTRALVDIEIYDPDGRKVIQHWWDDRSFEAGESRRFAKQIRLPDDASPGTYTLKIGIFGVHWDGLATWVNRADTFTVVR